MKIETCKLYSRAFWILRAIPLQSWAVFCDTVYLLFFYFSSNFVISENGVWVCNQFGI